MNDSLPLTCLISEMKETHSVGVERNFQRGAFEETNDEAS